MIPEYITINLTPGSGKNKHKYNTSPSWSPNLLFLAGIGVTLASWIPKLVTKDNDLKAVRLYNKQSPETPEPVNKIDIAAPGEPVVEDSVKSDSSALVDTVPPEIPEVEEEDLEDEYNEIEEMEF